MSGLTFRTRPLAVLVAGQALLLLVISTTNLTDLAVNANLFSTDWRSGNIDYIQSNLGRLDNPRWLAVLGVVFAAWGQLVAGSLYVRALVALVKSPPTALDSIRTATTGALIVWMVLSLGTEAFIMYPGAGWSSFFLLMILAVVTWWMAEATCSQAVR